MNGQSLALPLDPPAARRRARADSGVFDGSSSLSEQERARVIARLKLIARLLDDCITIPGTNWRIGLDPIIGLAPGVGDAVSLALSAYIIYEGKRLGATPATLAKMAANVAVDAIVGLVPVLGDAADFVLKANRRNLALLGIEP